MNHYHCPVAQRIVTQHLNAQRSFSTCRLVALVLLIVMLPWTFFPVACQAAEPEFAIEQQADRLVITWGGQAVATYVFADNSLTRPYFAHVHAPGGQQVTRNHPPLDGEDRMDHAELHPGIWLAFGDLSGGDFWRNKDRIVHEAFTQAPAAVGQKATFSVRNRYERADGTAVCHEICEFTFNRTPFGYMLYWDSRFSGEREFYFGDQEEMGLGIRVATPISVEGGGTMSDSAGRRNEKEIWGNSADWCDYSGRVEDQQIGITIMWHSKNFRPCWMHSRDYGFLAANPFGRHAFGKGETSKVSVLPGESLRLRYGILLHSSVPSTPPDIAAAYQAFLQHAESNTLRSDGE